MSKSSSNSTMPVKLFNTMRRAVEVFEPIEPGKVSIYCCGPTVYDYQHIGNLRTYIFEDALVRSLRYAGYTVNHVMNVTDVGHLVSDADEGEDKMVVAMKREKKKSHEIAEYYTDVFLSDCAELNIGLPDTVCKATEHIQEMIELIQRIEANGLTYFAGGNVYFDVSKFEKYGELAQLDLEKLQAGARIEVDPNKKSPFDFVLWFTKSKFEGQELQWDSPWGTGYPGWHIECSAMSMKYLGEYFDIHCGGIDHVPVHHTNEIAQSEAATQKNWVNYWMHGEFLVDNTGKMSKSKGEFLVLDTVKKKGIDPLAYRLMCLGAHYRQQLTFTWEALEGAAQSLKKLRSSVLAIKAKGEMGLDSVDKEADVYARHLSAFRESILNDLNTAQGLACVWNVLSDKELSEAEKLSLVYNFDSVLGLGAAGWQAESVDVTPELEALLKKREVARADKDWAEADRLRDEIFALGFVVKDGADGQTLEKA